MLQQRRLTDEKNYYLLLALTVGLTMAMSCSALVMERLFTFSNNNDNAVKEVNYYLEHGAEVKYLHTAAKNTDSTVIITLVLEIPQGIPAYKK